MSRSRVPVPETNKTITRQLLIYWVVANAAAQFVAQFVDQFVALVVPQLLTVIGILVNLLVLGYAQSMIIARYFPRLRQRFWIAATLIGGIAGTLVGSAVLLLTPAGGSSTSSVLYVAGVLVNAAIVGAAIAVAQWWMLRPYVGVAIPSSWILAYVVGSVLALLVANLLPLLGMNDQTSYVIGGSIMPSVGAALLGLLTGLILVRFWEQYQDQESTSSRPQTRL